MTTSSRTFIVLAGVLCFIMSSPDALRTANAQVVVPPITASGLNTQVGAPINVPGGKVQHDITGGTRPNNGPNLFHSFGEFGVPTNNIANFRNDSALATSNILGRVTGGNPSNIFGMIKTTDFGNANLFLMNPAGILFGPNATLNVGGSVHFTTADYLRLTDGVRFNAIPDTAADALLSTAPVAAFGFLSSSPAAISVQGSMLSVVPGESISLVGGNISIQAGTLDDGTNQPTQLSAQGGQIRLVSVASPGEILHPTLDIAPNIDSQIFTSMGTIAISANAVIEASGDPGGTVLIRGGQLVIADATISADTADANGSPVAIDINVTGDLSISDTRGSSAITSRTTGAGDAGEVRIVSANLVATSNFAEPIFSPLIDSHTAGTGKAGDVNITTGNLDVAFIGLIRNNAFTFINSGTTGPGHGADVMITADSIQLDTTTISTGDLVARNLLLEPSGSAGNLTITATAGNLRINFSLLNTEAFAAFADSQQGGNITINAKNIRTARSQIDSTGIAGGGVLIINADTLVADSTFFQATTISGPSGGIVVNSRVVELTNGSSLISTTLGDGKAGDIQINASDHLSLLGHTVADPSNEGIFRPSGLFSNSTGDFGSGDAGRIIVSTPTLIMADGGRINTSTASSGRGGNVIINSRNVISISGEFFSTELEDIFRVGPIHPSGIFTKTVGTDLCLGPCGDAGSISIVTGSLVMDSGSAIDSGTTSAGRGGEIFINATGNISLSGTLSEGTPSGIFSRTVDAATGAGGNISLQANQVSLSNGAAISAQSTSIGEAGNISIQAADSFISRNSTVNTSTAQSDGGNITITAGNMLQLDRSEITTNVQGGAGNGGNISIDPPTVLIDHSKIIASAIGGNGGNINIVAGVFLVSPDSIIDASSTFGLSGTINIESPIQNLSGTLAPLPQGFLQVAGLLQARCAARFQSGLSSSLVVAGRDAVPLEPGDVLPGPIFSRAAQATVSRNERPSFQMSQTFNEILIDDGLALAVPKGRC